MEFKSKSICNVVRIHNEQNRIHEEEKETGTHTLKVPETVSLADLTADSRSNPGRSELLLVLSSDSLEAAYDFQSANKEGEDDVVAAVPVVCWSAENHFCIVKILLCKKIPHDYLGDNKFYIYIYNVCIKIGVNRDMDPLFTKRFSLSINYIYIYIHISGSSRQLWAEAKS